VTAARDVVLRGGPIAWSDPAVRSEASERAVWTFGKLCLVGYLAAQWISLTRLFLTEHLGGAAAIVASQAGLLSVGLLVPAVVSYGLRAGSLFGRLTSGGRLWAGTLLALATGLFAYGWAGQDYGITFVLHDLAPYLVLVCMAILGSMDQVWADLDPWMLALFLGAVVVNAIGMTGMTQVVTEAQPDDRAGIGIVAYRTQQALAFWPILFLTARLRRRWVALLLFASVCFVLAQQILFQKRAPTVRILLVVVLFLFVLPRLRPPRVAWPAGSERWVRTAFAGVAALAVVAGLTAAPWLFRGQLAGLTERISGSRYGGGAAGMLTYQNERFYEVGMFADTLEPQHWVIGRGFGGYFVPPDPAWGVWLDDVQEFGRRQLHVGALMPFFKGGLVLSIAFYSGLVAALARGRRLLREPFAAAAFFVLLIQAVFLMQESNFVMSMSYDVTLMALCTGYLLSLERRPPPEERA
jgi:hypothetical protein